jgi:hypothetical protein
VVPVMEATDVGNGDDSSSPPSEASIPRNRTSTRRRRSRTQTPAASPAEEEIEMMCPERCLRMTGAPRTGLARGVGDFSMSRIGGSSGDARRRRSLASR